MAIDPTADKLRKFGRIAPSAFRLPVPVLPKVPDLRAPKAREEFDSELEKWRKKLDYGQGDSFSSGGGGGGAVGGPTVVTKPGPQGIPGKNGEPGAPGPQGEDGGTAELEVIRIHVWIAKRTDNKPGRGVQWDPYDGSTTEKLDTLLRGFDENTVIHFGPGTFTTRGYPTWPIPAAYKWKLKTGWKLIGSGIDQTILKLADQASDTENFHSFIAYSEGIVDDVEISDITFDCNIQGQTVPVKTGALGLTGSRAIVRRIRIINWGTTTTTFEEPFAMGVGQTTPDLGDVFGCLLDGVIIEQPGLISEATGVGTMLGVGGSSTGYTWTNAGITRSGTTATLTLTGSTKHGLQLGQWFRVRTATQTEYNGSFQVTEVVSDSVVKYEVTGSPASPATGSPQIEHAPTTTLGTGMLRNLVVRNCIFDGGDHTGSGLHGMTVGGVDGAMIESNTLRNMTLGCYMDTWRGESVTYRNNFFQRVVTGIYFNLGDTAWGMDAVIVENNLMELLALPVVPEVDYVPMVNVHTNPVGVSIAGVREEMPYSFRHVIVRNNVFRYAEGVDSATYVSLAVTARSIDSLIIADNFIGFREPRQIRIFDPVNRQECKGNRNLDGAIVLTNHWETDLNFYDPDVELDRIGKLATIGF